MAQELCCIEIWQIYVVATVLFTVSAQNCSMGSTLINTTLQPYNDTWSVYLSLGVVTNLQQQCMENCCLDKDCEAFITSADGCYLAHCGGICKTQSFDGANLTIVSRQQLEQTTFLQKEGVTQSTRFERRSTIQPNTLQSRKPEAKTAQVHKSQTPVEMKQISLLAMKPNHSIQTVETTKSTAQINSSDQPTTGKEAKNLTKLSTPKSALRQTTRPTSKSTKQLKILRATIAPKILLTKPQTTPLAKPQTTEPMRSQTTQQTKPQTNQLKKLPKTKSNKVLNTHPTESPIMQQHVPSTTQRTLPSTTQQAVPPTTHPSAAPIAQQTMPPTTPQTKPPTTQQTKPPSESTKPSTAPLKTNQSLKLSTQPTEPSIVQLKKLLATPLTTLNLSMQTDKSTRVTKTLTTQTPKTQNQSAASSTAPLPYSSFKTTRLFTSMHPHTKLTLESISMSTFRISKQMNETTRIRTETSKSQHRETERKTTQGRMILVNIAQVVTNKTHLYAAISLALGAFIITLFILILYRFNKYRKRKHTRYHLLQTDEEY